MLGAKGQELSASGLIRRRISVLVEKVPSDGHLVHDVANQPARGSRDWGQGRHNDLSLGGRSILEAPPVALTITMAPNSVRIDDAAGSGGSCCGVQFE